MKIKWFLTSIIMFQCYVRFSRAYELVLPYGKNLLEKAHVGEFAILHIPNLVKLACQSQLLQKWGKNAKRSHCGFSVTNFESLQGTNLLKT